MSIVEPDLHSKLEQSFFDKFEGYDLGLQFWSTIIVASNFQFPESFPLFWRPYSISLTQFHYQRSGFLNWNSI